MKKHFELPEESINVIASVKEEYDFKTEVDALKFILSQYGQTSKEDEQTEIKKELAIIRKTLRITELEVFTLKHCMNTLLFAFRIFDEGENFFPARGNSIHDIVIQAEDEARNLLAMEKQKSDDKKMKKGI